MPSIRVLPDPVANQIAAGEVVERPAAVVKELVENALDAGASRIEVEFRHGGRSLIRVEDNGHGMSREDARLSLERHATSKIALAADLDNLATFGFRGEALPSIASVSTFQLRTRREADSEGTEILVEAGRIRHLRPCGMPTGTQVTVAQLFGPVPARRKFLKSDNTESAHIIQCVRLYALAYPSVAFGLSEEGRRHLQAAAGAEPAVRVGEVLGGSLAGLLQPVAAEDGPLRLHGFLGGAGVHRSTRQEITCFVNRRPVESRTLTYGLVEAFAGSIPSGRYPVAVLFLELPPHLVDVNVHPSKREVRFRDEPRVRQLVFRLAWDLLRAGEPAGRVLAGAAGDPESPSVTLPEPPAPRIPESTQPDRLMPAPAALAPVRPFEAGPVPAAPRSGYGRGWRWLGSAMEGYLVFETSAGLVLLDPRAAAERIQLEQLERAFAAGPAEGQSLLFPVSLQVSPIQADHLRALDEVLAQAGFAIAPFGGDVHRIEAVPSWLPPERAESFVRDVLGLAAEGRLPAGKPGILREELARLAARRAAPSAPPASAGQALQLVESLFRCVQPLVDASGKPTLIELSSGEVARRFSRR